MLANRLSKSALLQLERCSQRYNPSPAWRNCIGHVARGLANSELHSIQLGFFATRCMMNAVIIPIRLMSTYRCGNNLLIQCRGLIVGSLLPRVSSLVPPKSGPQPLIPPWDISRRDAPPPSTSAKGRRKEPIPPRRPSRV